MTTPPHLRWRSQFAPAPKRILSRAHDLVTFGWCQGAEARDAAGVDVEPWDAKAVQWSLLGALVAAVDLPPNPEPAYLGPLRRALSALAEVVEEPSLVKWNDDPERTQEHVVGILEAARHVCVRWETAESA
ncbi:MAG: hypothetical protein ACJ77E_15370 [Gaiellaceae bacterium]